MAIRSDLDFGTHSYFRRRKLIVDWIDDRPLGTG
jgi:hypothetical protein